MVSIAFLLPGPGWLLSRFQPQVLLDMPQMSLAPFLLEGTVLSSELASSTLAHLNQGHRYFGYQCQSPFIPVSVTKGQGRKPKLQAWTW